MHRVYLVFGCSLCSWTLIAVNDFIMQIRLLWIDALIGGSSLLMSSFCYRERARAVASFNI